MDLTKSNTNLFWYRSSSKNLTLVITYLIEFIFSLIESKEISNNLLDSSKNWPIFDLGTLDHDLGNAEFQDLEWRSIDCFEGCWPKYKSADDFLVVLKLMKWYWYRVITIEGLQHTILRSLSFSKSQIIERRFRLNC